MHIVPIAIACGSLGALIGFVIAGVLNAASRGEESQERLMAEQAHLHETTRAILGKVFEGEGDVAFGQWLDWYEPRDWAGWPVALGAFVRVRQRGGLQPTPVLGERPAARVS